MNLYCEIPKDELKKFERAIQKYVETRKKDIAQVLNQRAYNALGRAFAYLPPSNLPARQREVENYLMRIANERGAPLAAIIINKRLKAGNMPKKYLKESARDQPDPLKRKYLAVGSKGLYGKAMAKAVRSFVYYSKLYSGTLKAAFLALRRQLYNIVRFKKWYSSTSGYVVFSWTKRESKVTPANSYAPNYNVEFKWSHYLFPATEGRSINYIERAWTRAIQEETAEIYKHLEQVLKK